MYRSVQHTNFDNSIDNNMIWHVHNTIRGCFLLFICLLLSLNFNFLGWCVMEMTVNGMCIEKSRPVSRVSNALRYKQLNIQDVTNRGKGVASMCNTCDLDCACLSVPEALLNKLFIEIDTKNKRNGVWTAIFFSIVSSVSSIGDHRF